MKKYLFVKIGFEEQHKDSVLAAIGQCKSSVECFGDQTNIKIYKQELNKEQADYVEYSIRDNPV